ncbi:MAG: hypothetical protein AAFN79_12405 [Pseudomonadota bacterium]
MVIALTHPVKTTPNVSASELIIVRSPFQPITGGAKAQSIAPTALRTAIAMRTRNFGFGGGGVDVVFGIGGLLASKKEVPLLLLRMMWPGSSEPLSKNDTIFLAPTLVKYPEQSRENGRIV